MVSATREGEAGRESVRARGVRGLSAGLVAPEEEGEDGSLLRGVREIGSLARGRGGGEGAVCAIGRPGDSRWVELLARFYAAARARLLLFCLVLVCGGAEDGDGGFFNGRGRGLQAAVEDFEAGVFGEAGLVRAHVVVEGVFELGFLEGLVAAEGGWG